MKEIMTQHSSLISGDLAFVMGLGCPVLPPWTSAASAKKWTSPNAAGSEAHSLTNNPQGAQIFTDLPHRAIWKGFEVERVMGWDEGTQLLCQPVAVQPTNHNTGLKSGHPHHLHNYCYTSTPFCFKLVVYTAWGSRAIGIPMSANVLCCHNFGGGGFCWVEARDTDK